MTARQLAGKLGVAQQAVALIEKDEQSGSVTIKTMRRIGEGLDCVFVCGFVPRSSLEKTLRRQAERLAARRLARASQTMTLEDQALCPKENERVLAEMVDDLVPDTAGRTMERTMTAFEYPAGATPRHPAFIL